MDFDLLSRELVRAIRGERSQPAFSRRLGYTSNVVHTWEAGRRFPTAAEFLRAAQRAGVDVRDACCRFYRTPPPWLETLEPASPAGVAALLRDLRGHMPLQKIADHVGSSRFAIARWLGGDAEPRLPAFLAMVETTSLRLLDLVAVLVDPSALPSVTTAWAALEAQRRTAYELPWTQAVLRALELADYQALPAHQPGWIALRLGIPGEDEKRCLEVLAASKQIRWEQERWSVENALAVDTRRDPAAGRRLKAWWASVGLERLRDGADGTFSYNVFSVSDADYVRLRELHLAYFRELRSLVATSTPGEHVVVANVQLFALRSR